MNSPEKQFFTKRTQSSCTKHGPNPVSSPRFSPGFPPQTPGYPMRFPRLCGTRTHGGAITFPTRTVGRAIVNDHLPEQMTFINGPLNKRTGGSPLCAFQKQSGLGQLVHYCYLKFGLTVTVGMLDEVKNLGFLYATRAGISIGNDDMVVAPWISSSEKASLVANAEKELVACSSESMRGSITTAPSPTANATTRSSKSGPALPNAFPIKCSPPWKRTRRTGRYLNPISGSGATPRRDLSPPTAAALLSHVVNMADSGARGSKQQIRQLSGMRGLMAKPSSEIIETPITANFREGLNVLQYFISTHGARKGLADTALKTADSGYLTRRLVDVAQDVIVTEDDCGTTEGIVLDINHVELIVESGEIIEPLRDRIVGRVALPGTSSEDQLDFEGKIIVSVNQEITEDLAGAIQGAGIERVRIRSVLTCESKRGVCRSCYGRNLATGRLVERGEPVGVIAAQSIGEPGTQLTCFVSRGRTFHIGGTATRISEQVEDARTDGFAKYIDIQSVRNVKNEIISMNRSGIFAIRLESDHDDKGREKERYQVVYGAHITVADGDPVKANMDLLEWDPYTFSILTELTGVVHFKDLQEGITLAEQVDEVTGMSQLVVTDSPDEKRQPMVQIKGPLGMRKYLMPTHAHLMVRDGEEVHAGDVLVL